MSEEFLRTEIAKYRKIIEDANSEKESIEENIVKLKREMEEYPTNARMNFYMQVVQTKGGKGGNSGLNVPRLNGVQHAQRNLPLDGDGNLTSAQLDSTLPGFSDKITNRQMVEKFKMSYEKDLLIFQQMVEKNQIPHSAPGLKRSQASEANSKPQPSSKDHFFITETQQSQNLKGELQNNNLADLVNRLNHRMLSSSKLNNKERKDTEYDSYVVEDDSQPIGMDRTVTEVSDTIDIGSQNVSSFLLRQKEHYDKNKLKLTDKFMDSQIDNISKPMNMNFLDNLRNQMEQSADDNKSIQPSPSQLVDIRFNNESDVENRPKELPKLNDKASPKRKDSFDDTMFISNFSLDPEEKAKIQEELKIEDSLLKTDFYTIKEKPPAELNQHADSKSIANKLDFNDAISRRPDLQNTPVSNPLSVLGSPVSNLQFKRPASSGIRQPGGETAHPDISKFAKQKASSNIVINFDNYSNYKNTINPFPSEKSPMRENELILGDSEEIFNLENSGTNFLQKNKEVLNKFDDFFRRTKITKEVGNSFDPRPGFNRELQSSVEQMMESYNSPEFDRIFKNSDQKYQSKKSLIRYN